MAFDLTQTTGADEEELESSNSMPLIRILQINSPQVNELEEAYVEGAKAGMFFLGDHKVAVKGPIEIIPVGQKSCYAEWKPKSAGGGLVAHHSLAIVNDPAYEQGRDPEKPYLEYLGANDLVRTSYWCVLMKYEGVWENKLIAMTSSQLKVARALSQKIKSFKYDGIDAKAPMFAQSWTLEAKPEKNAKGEQYYNFSIGAPRVLDLEDDEALLTQAFEAYGAAKTEMLPSSEPVAQQALPAGDDSTEGVF